MTLPAVAEIKVAVLPDLNVAITKCIKHAGKKATIMPSTIVHANDYNSETKTEQHLVQTSKGKGLLVSKSSDGKKIVSTADGKCIIQFEHHIARTLQLAETATEFGWFIVHEGLILIPRQRTWIF